MDKKKRNALIIGAAVGAGLASLAAVSYSVTKTLMKVALDREVPKGIEKGRNRLMGSGELAEILPVLEDAGKDLEALNLEQITITAPDGVSLVGHYYDCPNAKRVIIAMHGWRSSWANDFGIISKFWHNNGCSVLYCEQRGQGNSGGEYMGFGVLEQFDCLKWIEYMDERLGGSLPIYLGGVSMGASTVLFASGNDLPKSVKGIVADCGFNSPHGIWKYVTENNLKLPYVLYKALANNIYLSKTQVDIKTVCCADALKNCKVPVLFIHGTDDKFVPVTMTYENYKACASKKKLFVVPGADHGMSYLVDREGYEAEVKAFWAENDK